jgi:hypothetical protein
METCVTLRRSLHRFTEKIALPRLPRPPAFLQDVLCTAGAETIALEIDKETGGHLRSAAFQILGAPNRLSGVLCATTLLIPLFLSRGRPSYFRSPRPPAP